MVGPGPKKITPYLARFIRSINSCQVERGTPVSASMTAASSSTPLARARRVQRASNSLARLDGDELVGRRMPLRFLERQPRRKTGPRGRAAETGLGFQAIPAQVARMALDRVAAPEDDQVAAVLDFAQGAGDLADLLQCQGRGTAIARRVDGSTQAPIQSAIDTATRWASVVVSQSPRTTGYVASSKISRGPFDPIVQRGWAVPRSNRPALARSV